MRAPNPGRSIPVPLKAGPSITVTIINYRTAAMTIDCLRSVVDDMDRAAVAGQVVVVDNRSDDGSAEAIDAWIAGEARAVPVRLIRSATNSGYSGGHNQGMAAAPADHYLILNSDALLRPGFFTALLKAVASDPGGRTGLIVPRLEGEDGVAQVNCFRFAGPGSEFIRGANTGPVTRLLSGRVVALDVAPPDSQIEWASFACILLDARMVAEIGPMDEGYFLYFEDAEYCLRARRAGWRIRRAPDAVAVHLRGGSGPVKALAKARKRAPEYYYRSRSRFLAQAHGRAGLWAANLAWHAGRAVGQLRRLTGRRPHPVAEHEAGDLWIGARNPTTPHRAEG